MAMGEIAKDEATECLGGAGDLGGDLRRRGAVRGMGRISGPRICRDVDGVWDFAGGDAGLCGARRGGGAGGKIWGGWRIFSGGDVVRYVRDVPGGDGYVCDSTRGGNGGVCVCAAGTGGFVG